MFSKYFAGQECKPLDLVCPAPILSISFLRHLPLSKYLCLHPFLPCLADVKLPVDRNFKVHGDGDDLRRRKGGKEAREVKVRK